MGRDSGVPATLVGYCGGVLKAGKQQEGRNQRAKVGWGQAEAISRQARLGAASTTIFLRKISRRPSTAPVVCRIFRRKIVAHRGGSAHRPQTMPPKSPFQQVQFRPLQIDLGAQIVFHGDAGRSVSRCPGLAAAAPVNLPLARRGHPDAPRLSRKYRRAADARSRKAKVQVH